MGQKWKKEENAYLPNEKKNTPQGASEKEGQQKHCPQNERNLFQTLL